MLINTNNVAHKTYSLSPTLRIMRSNFSQADYRATLQDLVGTYDRSDLDAIITRALSANSRVVNTYMAIKVGVTEAYICEQYDLKEW